MIEPEEWRPVVGWEGLYEVSSLGRVRSIERFIEATSKFGMKFLRPIASRDLKARTGQYGYLIVNFCRTGRSYRLLVHRIVCLTFHGIAPAGHEVAHNDGCKLNNAKNNLRWATRKDNAADTNLHGTVRLGENHQNHKLTVDQVKSIWTLRDKISDSELARRYGVSSGTIHCIRLRKTWKHITEGLL